MRASVVRVCQGMPSSFRALGSSTPPLCFSWTHNTEALRSESRVGSNGLVDRNHLREYAWSHFNWSGKPPDCCTELLSRAARMRIAAGTPSREDDMISTGVQADKRCPVRHPSGHPQYAPASHSSHSRVSNAQVSVYRRSSPPGGRAELWLVERFSLPANGR